MPFGQTDYPNSNPIMRGMFNALSIASYLQRAQMQQREFEMAKRREARMEEQAAQQRQAQDLDILSKMNTAGRPVRGGMVEDSLVGLLPDKQLKALGIEDPAAWQIMRPPQGPVAKYKDAGGTLHEFEFLTPDEQIARQQKAALNQAEALGELKNELAIDLFKRQTLDLPGYGTVNKAVIPSLVAAANRDAANQRAQAGIASRERVANLNAGVRVATTAAREQGANARAAANNKTRREIADEISGRRGGVTPAQLNQLQRDHDKLDRDEQKIWTKVNAIKATLKAGKTLDSDGKKVKLNPLQIAKFRQQEADLRREAETLQQQKRTKLAQMGKEANGKPIAPAAAINPYRVIPGANPYR